MMLRWSIKLCGLEIIFKPWTAIKAQALVDLPAEGSFTESNMERNDSSMEPCELKVDRAVNASYVRVGVVLTSPNKQYTKMWAIKLKPNLSNNQAEYKVLLIGMEWAHGANITALIFYRDSQLVVN